MYIEKGIFDVMAGYSINERMDGLLLQNEEYIKMQNKIEEQIMLFDKLNLTKEQCLVVDRLISAHTESGVIYGKMAYKQGFQDCAALLLEMRLLKTA